MMQHGILQTELDAYLPAMLADAEQLALSVDTQPHIDMCNLAIETLSNEQVLNSNVQSQQVRHVCYLSMRVSSKPSVARSRSRCAECANMRVRSTPVVVRCRGGCGAAPLQ